MTERLWYPKFLIDEILPVGRESPQAWLTLLLSKPIFPRTPWFDPGDTLLFQYVESRGNIEITIQPDGTHSSTNRCSDTPDMFAGAKDQPPEAATNPAPPANSFWDHESETHAETLDEFAQMYAGIMGDDEEYTVSVSASYWSDDFLYRISDDGKSLTLETQSPTASAQETSSC